MAAKKPKLRRGPQPSLLKIEGDWTAAVRKALAAGKPPKAKAKRKRRAYSRA